MEIIKNNKIYFYSIIDNGEYNYLCDKLSDLNITRCRINKRYCSLFSKKRILTKLKKYFSKDKITFEGIDDYDKSYIYVINFS